MSSAPPVLVPIATAMEIDARLSRSIASLGSTHHCILICEIPMTSHCRYDIFKTGETPQNRPVNRKLTDATLKTMLRVSRMGTISSKPTGRPRQQVADVCVLFAQAGALNDHFQGLVLKASYTQLSRWHF